MLTFILSVCGLALVILSVLILYANYRDAANRWLSIFTLSGSLWVFMNLFANLAKDPHTNLLFSRLTLVGAALVPLAYLFFCVSFTYLKIRMSWRLLIYSPIILLLASVPTKLNIVSVAPKTLNITPGLAYVLLLLVFVTYFSYGAILLVREYHRTKQIQRRQQLRYILLGTIFTIVPGVLLSALLPLLGYADAASFGPAVSIIFAGTASIAILRHHLFDIRFLVVRAAAYGFTLVLVSLFYLLPAIWLLAHIAHVRLTVTTFISIAAVSFVLTILYKYLRRLFDRLTKRVFYRHYYEPQDVLDKLGDLLARTIDINRLRQGSSQILVDALSIDFFEYWFGGSGPDYDQVERIFRQSRTESVIIIDELPVHLVDTLRAQGVGALVRLRTTHGELGYIVLGLKKSGEPYTQKDKRFLSTVADEIAISMQNALHFEETQNFNKTLRDQVNKATTELRQTNAKLKQLDETKDEFITMASHQLRTPLTSVKGYLSMVLEGDAGKLNSNQEKLLEQSYLSSQRMVYLISDLLNLSRLNTGKFVIEPSEVDLSEVAQVEVDQLEETAKARNLTLLYDRPATFPKLMLDETKIHQVVMNFIDNAIYYTPSGGTVTVSLRETPAAVEYTVKDTGIGVPKAVQHKLFTKFYRAGNAQQARPDGTGLGLFMAKKVVAAQGGAIIFASEEGKGSTFGFRFNKANHAVSGVVGKTGPAKRAPKQPTHH